MSNRKLVSVQEITGIDPIEGADRVEVARVLGWRVVVGKDMHLKPGIGSPISRPTVSCQPMTRVTRRSRSVARRP